MIISGISESTLLALTVASAAFVLALLMAVLYIVGFWMTLQKMGRHDFASLVPLYGDWELARGAGLGPLLATLFAVLSIGSTVCLVVALFGVDYEAIRAQLVLLTLMPVDDLPATVLSYLQGLVIDFYDNNTALVIAAAVFVILHFLMMVVVYFGIARSFRHGVFCTLAMIIFPWITFLILGCSRGQVYEGPALNPYRHMPANRSWASMVQARKDTFGSNAPLAMALLGMIMGATFMTIPGVILCFLALVRNGADKGKPLAHAKTSMTTLTALFGILISIAVVAGYFALRFLSNSHFS